MNVLIYKASNNTAPIRRLVIIVPLQHCCQADCFLLQCRPALLSIRQGHQWLLTTPAHGNADVPLVSIRRYEHRGIRPQADNTESGACYLLCQSTLRPTKRAQRPSTSQQQFLPAEVQEQCNCGTMEGCARCSLPCPVSPSHQNALSRCRSAASPHRQAQTPKRPYC